VANQLTMADIQAILTLHARGWRNRRIARELNIDRETVAKYIRASACVPKPAKAPIGSEVTGEQAAEGLARPLPAVPFSEERGIVASRSSFLLEAEDGDSKPAKAPIGSALAESAKAPLGLEPLSATGPAPMFLAPAGPDDVSAGPVPLEEECGRSACEPYRLVILEKLEQGLSAQRIYQDLVGDGFDQKYHSVRRFVAKLQKTSPLPFRRMESAAGEEAQIDFGTGAWIELPDGGAPGTPGRRRSHVFRIVLSYSRKGYCEAVYRQTTEDFIRCIENAFWHFAGVPKILVIDNLKAGVKQPDWYDPDLNPKLQSFCEHYGCVILPTKPRTPRHKGKIESGVNYVQENGLKGHSFTSLEKQNEHLLDWETTVADTRLHGTIRKQVGKLFQEVERSALQPLPVERFPFFHEGERTVHRDGHVEVAKAYYSVPAEYRGHTLWVRWDLRLVRIFNNRMQQMCLHPRKEPGQFSTLPEHIHSQKRSAVELGTVALLSRARCVGEHTARWAEAMIQARGIEGVRVLVGLLALKKQYDSKAIEQACEVAYSHSAWRLKTLRKLLKRGAPKQETFDFLGEHPIIRPLSDYGKLVSTSFQQPGTPVSQSVVDCCSFLLKPQETL
jgi:transposase